MGGFISGLMGAPLKGLLDGVGGILDKFVVNPEEKLKAQQEILKMQSDLQLKLLEVDGEFAKQQAAVISEEVKSESWLARNWRPLLMLTFTYIIAHNYVLAPLFSFHSVEIPPDMWQLLKLGMGGYIMGRSVEKVATTVPDLIDSIKK